MDLAYADVPNERPRGLSIHHKELVRTLRDLVAVGGDLHPSTLLAAYRQGLFPWFNPGEPILWWSPDPRCIMRPGDFHPSKSLRRRARSSPYQLSIDQAFAEVVRQCAAPRAYADGDKVDAAFKAIRATAPLEKAQFERVSRSLGVDCVLAKPTSRERLLAAVRQFVA